MMSRILPVAHLLCLLSTTARAQALLAVDYINGANCHYDEVNLAQSPTPPDRASMSFFSGTGVSFTAVFGTLYVRCPIHYESLTTPYLVGAFRGATFFYSDNTTTRAVACTLFATDYYANSFFGQTKHSCSTDGGCLSPEPSFKSMTMSASYLTFEAIDSPNAIFRSISAKCAIPAKQDSNVPSGIRNYQMLYELL